MSKPRSSSVADRFAAFLAPAPISTVAAPAAPPPASTAAATGAHAHRHADEFTATSPSQAHGAKSPSARGGGANGSSGSAVTSPTAAAAATPTSSASSSSGGGGGGFFSSLKSRALESLAAHRSEAAAKASAKAAGLTRITTRMWMLAQQPAAAASGAGPAAEAAQHADRAMFHALATHLSTYHDGRYLLIDVGGCLASRGCPDSLFLTARLSQEFGPPGAEGGLGPIDAAARIARAVQRWWAADLSGQSVVILVAEPLQRAQILAATVLHYAHSYPEPLAALHAVLLSYSNRLSAQLQLRSLPPSTRRFLSDFSLVHQWDPSFAAPAPRVWIHSLLIHRLPAVEEEGTRLMVCIIANRSQFLYTSAAQGGGHVWVPCSYAAPLSVSIPLAVELAGEASIKVWHLPEQASTANPRQMIFETKVHSAVLALPCFREAQQGGRIDGSVPGKEMVAAAAAAAAGKDTPPSADSSSPDSAATASASSPPAPSSSSSSVASAAASPFPYALHRFTLRRDELDLSGSGSDISSGDDAAAAASLQFDIDYSKNFRIDLICTPMEEGRYVKSIETGRSASASASSAAVASSAPPPPAASPASMMATARERSSSRASSPPQPSSANDGTSVAASAELTAAAALPLAQPVPAVDGAAAGAAGDADASYDAAEEQLDLLKLQAAYSLPAAQSTPKRKEKEKKHQRSGSAASTASAEEEPLVPSSSFATPTRTPANSVSGFSPPDAGQPVLATPAPRAVPATTETPRAGTAAAASASASSASSASFSSSSSSSPPRPTAADPSSPPPFVAPALSVPAAARTTAGLRWFYEDKTGRERAETAGELAERQRGERARATLDASYGRGQWRRAGGIIYTLDSDYSALSLRAVLEAQAHAQAQAEALAELGLSAARGSAAGGGGGGSFATQADAEAAMHRQLIRQYQQAQQQAYDDQQRAAAAAQSSGPTPQQILADPSSTAEQRDEALARMLQAQFDEEGEAEARAAAHTIEQEQAAASAARRLARRAARAARQQAEAQAAGGSASPHAVVAGVPSPLIVQPSNIVSVVGPAPSPAAAAAAGSGFSAAPSSAAHPGSASAPGEILPPEFVQYSADEELARRLQREFDSEAQQNVDQLSAAQRGLDPDRLHYEQLLSLQAAMGPARVSVRPSGSGSGGSGGRHPARLPVGASPDEIAQLPEFRIESSSKYVVEAEECQICREQFEGGDVLRQLQCIHAYHRVCVDPWLRQNRTCPVCKVPVHHAE